MSIRVRIGLGIVVAMAIIGAVVVLGSSPTYDGVPATWAQARSIVRAQLAQATPGKQLLTAHSDIFPGVYVTFAIPQPNGGYILVSNEEVEKWGVTKKEVQDRALHNLERSVHATDLTIQILPGQPSQRYMIVETGDGFAAARILSEKIRERIKKELGEPYIAAMPSRDFLIVWPEGFATESDFIKQVKKEYEADAEFALSPDIYRFNGTTIEVGNTAEKPE